jgi:starch synthase
MHVLHVASELHPFSKTGGLADMVGALTKTLAATGHRVHVVTPLYRGIRPRHPELHPANWRFDLPLGPSLVPGEFWKLEPEPNLTLWFVDQPHFFDRAGIYGEGQTDYPDNAARFAFFAKASLLLARYLPTPPQIVHLHDWQTGLIPLFLQHAQVNGDWAKPPKSIFTIHNLAYQGWFPASDWALTNLSPTWFHLNSAEAWGRLNFLKCGVSLADALTTVSPRYATEICTPEYGCGLEGLLRRREYELTGILNGVDYAEWNTLNNPALKHAYDVNHLAGKAALKAELQQELGLPVRADVPLFTKISRLTHQKGSDFLIEALEEVLTERPEFQFALLGSGDAKLQEAYRDLAARRPLQVAARIGFDPRLAHRIEAGADFFLMPSRFEPCGLNQLYSLRYGTVPIVRATGGLDDSVTDLRENAERATGIKFREPTAEALAHAIRKALALFGEPALLAHFRRNGMTADFSWEKQAKEYVELYDHVLHGV